MKEGGKEGGGGDVPRQPALGSYLLRVLYRIWEEQERIWKEEQLLQLQQQQQTQQLDVVVGGDEESNPEAGLEGWARARKLSWILRESFSFYWFESPSEEMEETFLSLTQDSTLSPDPHTWQVTSKQLGA